MYMFIAPPSAAILLAGSAAVAPHVELGSDPVGSVLQGTQEAQSNIHGNVAQVLRQLASTYHWTYRQRVTFRCMPDVVITGHSLSVLVAQMNAQMRGTAQVVLDPASHTITLQPVPLAQGNTSLAGTKRQVAARPVASSMGREHSHLYSLLGRVYGRQPVTLGEYLVAVHLASKSLEAEETV